MGRLINHSKYSNTKARVVEVDGIPHVILIAKKNILQNEEILFDYGDRRRGQTHGWRNRRCLDRFIQ